MKISVVGTGYVGLVSAAGFAEHGHDVTCIDVVKEKVDLINKKISPIYEEGLTEILEKRIGKNMHATLDGAKAIAESEITYICVGTPSGKEGEIDLQYIQEVGKIIGEVLKGKKEYHVVVVKSTVVAGTTEEIVIPIIEQYSQKKAGRDFGVAMNPEFLREGVAVEDFLKPDRIVVGGIDQRSIDVIKECYKGFGAPILEVGLKTAEMIKYASNCLLATKISFINEIGNICKHLGIDTYDVARGVGLDHRISPHFLRAGLGFGGSCFPKDVKALRNKAEELGIEHDIMNSVLQVNAHQPKVFLGLAKDKLGSFRGKRVAVLGLAFKAGTDDTRESPALVVVEYLIKEGSKVIAYDPQAMDNTEKIFGNRIEYAKTAQDALKNADIALITTDWEEFSKLDYSEMGQKIVLDARHIVDKGVLPDDVEYEGLCW
ncbi:MAG: UDP-glucose/GDP-mannose dehydrogenase family protein [Candidatus Altiarchaeota archaeon]